MPAVFSPTGRMSAFVLSVDFIIIIIIIIIIYLFIYFNVYRHYCGLISALKQPLFSGSGKWKTLFDFHEVWHFSTRVTSLLD